MGDVPQDSSFPPLGSPRPGIDQDEAQAASIAPPGSSNVPQQPGAVSPFHAQYHSLPHPQSGPAIARTPAAPGHLMYGASPGSDHGPSTFNMGAMAGALPEYNPLGQAQAQQHGQRTLSGASTPALVYQLQQNLQYSNQPPSPYPGQAFNPVSFAPPPQYGSSFAPGQSMSPGGAYGMVQPSQQRSAGSSPSYPTFPQQPQQYMYYPSPYPPQPQHLQQYTVQPPQQMDSRGRRSSFPASQVPHGHSTGDSVVLGGNPPSSGRVYSSSVVPGDPTGRVTLQSPFSAQGFQMSPLETSIGSLPRGPPRKPKQSGHALWVGNLPPGTTVSDLKDHFSREATKDIESLFFIAKSNCAFVNYRTEAACTAAMHRFHDSRFHGVRLVCRLRRSSTATAGIPTAPSAMSGPRALSISSQRSSPSQDEDVEDGEQAEQVEPAEPAGVEEKGKEPSTTERMAEKFFIVKSLTIQDLELSVRNGIWATQSHNEETLNKAYGSADNVYLIFSANKSGEYFGYARMASPIMEDATEIMDSLPKTNIVDASDAPKSIPTPATEFAPKGRIIDDSARGTIFWEADLSDSEEETTKTDEEGASVSEGDPSSAAQAWGKPFRVEWISTNRLPFYRTRGLRNSWNANREVKIARDGTELETSVGKRLIQMFHRPGPPNTTATAPTVSPLQPRLGGPQMGSY